MLWRDRDEHDLLSILIEHNICLLLISISYTFRKSELFKIFSFLKKTEIVILEEQYYTL